MFRVIHRRHTFYLLLLCNFLYFLTRPQPLKKRNEKTRITNVYVFLRKWFRSPFLPENRVIHRTHNSRIFVFNFQQRFVAFRIKTAQFSLFLFLSFFIIHLRSLSLSQWRPVGSFFFLFASLRFFPRDALFFFFTCQFYVVFFFLGYLPLILGTRKLWFWTSHCCVILTFYHFQSIKATIIAILVLRKQERIYVAVCLTITYVVVVMLGPSHIVYSCRHATPWGFVRPSVRPSEKWF